MTLQIVPITIKAANKYVEKWHRHHGPVHGALFAAAVSDGEQVRGVAIVGRPVSRMLQDGLTCEVVRVAADGHRNACSMLLGACRRAARALGYARILTYTLPEEGGASLRAAGFRLDGDAGNKSALWQSRPGRSVPALGEDMLGSKWRWVG